MAVVISPPDQAGLLAPILPALPAAAASTQPAIQVLPLLSPILRQRVQLLSTSSTEPWLRLLCYDTCKAAKLADIARGPTLEPHPVSGEVEVDWGYDAETRYRRLDQETLQALVALPELGLAFQLVYCVNDKEGGGDGWRIGEVTVAEKPSPFSHFGGASTITEAERQYTDVEGSKDSLKGNTPKATTTSSSQEEENDEDDDYWARYDATPARTPAQNRSPAPAPGNASVPNSQPSGTFRSTSAEEEYFAQYDHVQPAMDNHDPDEEAQAADIMPPLGYGQTASAPHIKEHANEVGAIRAGVSNAEIALQHPRPDSSASSNGSNAVAKLEESAGKQEQNEFGVKQHVSRSIRSLYMLSKASGIDRDEFDRLVKTELDLLGMMDEGE
ncbi:hypothetical protein QQS21_009458 [Conoideocrella luteorostrata]|uniref:Uncharacterized protein n=1 Tax=Conoideocrella luteorostrata TaxID=1105319 RepID=A0AAJ0CH74_9HYPO|nr:hypothetical protein QQS21_009458 [Conoideocrella luteorostrata]